MGDATMTNMGPLVMGQVNWSLDSGKVGLEVLPASVWARGPEGSPRQTTTRNTKNHTEFPGMLLACWDPAVEYLGATVRKQPLPPEPGDEQEVIDVPDGLGLQIRAELDADEALVRAVKAVDHYHELDGETITTNQIPPKPRYPFREHDGQTWYTTIRDRKRSERRIPR